MKRKAKPHTRTRPGMFKSHASQTDTEVMLHEDCWAKIPLFGGVVKCLCTWVVVNFLNSLSLSFSLSLCN